MTRIRAALLTLGALGCGVPAEDFATEYPEALCTWMEECAAGPLDQPSEVCITSIEAGLDEAEACDYSATKAKQCLAALEAGCDERVAVYYECKRVYRGDDCPVDLSSSLSGSDTGQ